MSVNNTSIEVKHYEILTKRVSCRGCHRSSPDPLPLLIEHQALKPLAFFWRYFYRLCSVDLQNSLGLVKTISIVSHELMDYCLVLFIIVSLSYRRAQFSWQPFTPTVPFHVRCICETSHFLSLFISATNLLLSWLCFIAPSCVSSSACNALSDRVCS